MNETEKNQNLLRFATYASVGVATILIIAKLVTYVMTSSVSMLSSLVDSSLDALASFVNMYAVYVSLMPPDKHHRFGHGKAEPLAGLFQAAFIFGSGIFLLFESFNRLFTPYTVKNIDMGLYIMGISMALTFALIMFQKYVIKKTSSVAISADMAHYSGDILMNVGVVLSLIIYKWLDFQYIDSIFSFLVSIYLITTSYKVTKTSIEYLMDRELPEEIRVDIIKIALEQKEVCGVHDVKTRSSGTHYFIQLHVELDEKMSLRKAHTIADNIEKEIMKKYTNSEVIVHQDPKE
ncbi:MAG: Ferrous-iron efflux pump FieF [Alphaproteobacteria bacterium ADurb.Bin438]|nr:MAG: Ferrous-iron efflux pump FieF [Alphaproteobacteria bacterium ADurb.Bin438]